MDVLPKFKNKSCGDIKKIFYSVADQMPEDTVYRKIEKLCFKNDLTLKQLARKAGIKYNTLTGYKNRIIEYNLVTLQKIASVFGYNIDYFIQFDMLNIGDRIKYLRITRGYGVSEFAKLIGVHRDTIRTWESNKILPSESNLLLLSAFFGEHI